LGPGMIFSTHVGSDAMTGSANDARSSASEALALCAVISWMVGTRLWSSGLTWILGSNGSVDMAAPAVDGFALAFFGIANAPVAAMTSSRRVTMIPSGGCGAMSGECLRYPKADRGSRRNREGPRHRGTGHRC